MPGFLHASRISAPNGLLYYYNGFVLFDYPAMYAGVIAMNPYFDCGTGEHRLLLSKDDWFSVFEHKGTTVTKKKRKESFFHPFVYFVPFVIRFFPVKNGRA